MTVRPALRATAWWGAYRAAAAVAAAAALPCAAAASLRGTARPWQQRMGMAPPLLGDARPAWIHAASVGEVRAVEPLLLALAERHRDLPLALSVMTASGRGAAARMGLPLAAPPFHPPLDFGPWVRRALQRLRPCTLLLVETELWPTLLVACRRAGIPVAVVNGRLSDRSLPRYRLARPLLAAALEAIAVFAMRSDEDAARIVALGAAPERVHVVGNVKYDAALRAAGGGAELPWASAAGLGTGPWVVFGSTAPGEEGAVLAAFEEIRRDVPGARALLAPRRPERWDRTADLVRGRGLPLVRRSELAAPGGGGAVPPGGVLLLDSLGELAAACRHGDVVFVGGSLVPRGGQNPLDAAAAARPVLFGPHLENFRDVEAALLGAGGALRVDAAGLGAQVARLLRDPAARADMGRAARAAVAVRAGATLRTLAIVEPLLALGTC